MTTTRTFDPRRGEVWLVEFDPSIGDEQQKVRPAVVVGRFVRRLGNLEGGQTDDIAMAIAVCVGLPAA